MKKTSILLAAIALLNLLNVNKSYAQKEQGQSVITVGVGYSLAGALISTYQDALVTEINLFAPGVKATSSALPALFGSYDYGISDVFSIGVAGSYQSWKVNVPSYVSGGTNYAASEFGISRMNFAARPLFHFGRNDNLDLYAGARIGFTNWANKITSTDPDLLAIGFGSSSGFSAGILFGTRYYFNDNIGLNLEISIGAPYAGALGVNFKF